MIGFILESLELLLLLGLVILLLWITTRPLERERADFTRQIRRDEP